MAIFVSKQIVVKSGLREYTASGTISSAGDYVEMAFNRAVRINQIYWKWETTSSWQIWIFDSEGLRQLIDSAGSNYEYVLNNIDAVAPRYFDVAAGGKLRVQLGSSGGGNTILSCVAESI